MNTHCDNCNGELVGGRCPICDGNFTPFKESVPDDYFAVPDAAPGKPCQQWQAYAILVGFALVMLLQLFLAWKLAHGG